MRVLLLLTLSSVFFLSNLWVSHVISREVRKGITERYILPTKMYLLFVPRDLTYGLSDLGFINTLAFIGYSVEKGSGEISRPTAFRIYDALSAVTFYNPSYFDPYYVGNAFLTWGAGLYEEAIKLLKRGMEHVRDWRIPFYIGFNYFYFLNNNLKGAEYMSIASRYPEAREYNLIPLLASRLYYEEGRIEVALTLLKEQLKVMRDERMKKAIRSRIVTLERAKMIYEAMRVFRKRYGRNPKSLEELEAEGLIPPGLRDSAGGKFYITPEGKVRSEKVLFPIKKKAIEER
ncbi:MAG: hypothetical protein Q9N26_08700 [Aquificota bacterium]|nr:hypothetical protein [Aquificota bacterium]